MTKDNSHECVLKQQIGVLDWVNILFSFSGPACSDTIEPIAGVSKHVRSVVITYSAEGSSSESEKDFPYFFRTIAENKQYK